MIPICRAIRTSSMGRWTRSGNSASEACPAPQVDVEIFLDVYLRRASFEPRVRNMQQRLFDATAAEVARVDQNGDGIISAVEGDIDTATDGFADNSRLYLPPTVFERFAVTREINDGLLAPRFSPSQRAWVLSGTRAAVRPSVPASDGRDADDR